MDMYQRYSRNLPALSRQEQELLHKKRVLVAGCGGWIPVSRSWSWRQTA